MGAVDNIFVQEGFGWRWVATVRAPVTPGQAKRAMRAIGAVRRGQPIRVVRVDGSWQPQPPPVAPAAAAAADPPS